MALVASCCALRSRASPGLTLPRVPVPCLVCSLCFWVQSDEHDDEDEEDDEDDDDGDDDEDFDDDDNDDDAQVTTYMEMMLLMRIRLT